MTINTSNNTYDYIIIGAGQAGLAMGYYLRQQGHHFLMLDGGSQVGEAWLKRWDSLRLFTPVEFNHLPGLKFPGRASYYPNKYDVADYFKKYVEAYQLPIAFNRKVIQVKGHFGAFKVTSQNLENSDIKEVSYLAKRIVVATGPFHTPSTPNFAEKLSPQVLQLHSSEYKNAAQLQPGTTVVVGAGDSGFQILDEIAKARAGETVYFAGDGNQKYIPQEILGKTLFWWLEKLGILSLNKYSWLGNQFCKRTQPIIGTNVKALLARDNIQTLGRMLNANKKIGVFEHQQIDEINNIVWATGFKPDFSWLKGIELDDKGYPQNYRGVSTTQGIYFIGLPWMFTRGSATLGAVKRDAKYLADALKKESVITVMPNMVARM